MKDIIIDLFSIFIGLIEELLPYILNIGFLLITFFLSLMFITFTDRNVTQEEFVINVAHVIIITIQFILLIIIQTKYKKQLDAYPIYKRTRFLNIVSSSVIYFVSLTMSYTVYNHAIYFFILFLIYSLLIKKMRVFIVIQVLCLLGLYLSHDKTIIEGLIIKNYIRNTYQSL